MSNAAVNNVAVFWLAAAQRFTLNSLLYIIL